MIVDCHTHLSRFANAGKAFSQIRARLGLVMERLGIDLSLVYPDTEPGSDVSDLETSLSLVRDHPQLLLLGTASIPALEPSAIERLDLLADSGEIVGVKLYPGFELFYPSEERCYPVRELCVQHDLPVVFHSGQTMGEARREAFNHPSEIATVAKRWPALRIVIAHFAQPHLAACRGLVLGEPNVHADISGLAHADVVTVCGQAAIWDKVAKVVTQQPEKVLFGTDWPICAAQEHLHLVDSLPVSRAGKRLILGRNAARLLHLAEEP
jgi:predicted TIM-barrel fold metal-dependent hydrolase